MVVSVPNVELNNGISMPQIGFGVFRIPDDDTERTVLEAIECGYRSIDTASLYGNERGVGRAIASCGLPRDDLFVSTKLWNDDQGRDRARPAFDESLDRLGLDHVDLYLIHWPKPSKDLYVQTWEELETLYAQGRVRAIGVSNFQPDHLDRLLARTRVVPAVNQIELHPFLQQERLRRYDADHGLATVAWSPLGQATSIADPVIGAIARRHGRTPAQVILRWHLQLGTVVIPKSTNPARMRENLQILDFALEEEDLAAIAALDAGRRLGPDPDERDTGPRAGFSSSGGRWVEKRD
ncbi:MAG TPA: aldo/keto reductase [Nakamurella sp.]|jgi:2,5-diketo-D-gluconate reductase A